MSVGASGRVVIEIDTELKRTLYAHLVKENLTLKEWFIRQAESYVNESLQPSLFASLRSDAEGASV